MMLFIAAAFAGMSSSALTGVMDVSVSDVIQNSPDEYEIATMDGRDLGDVTVFCKATPRGDLRCRVESDARVGFEIGPIGLTREGGIEFDYVAGRDTGTISIEPTPTPIGIAPIPSP